MITQVDVNKLKTIFATKDEMYLGFQELVKFIGETKSDIMKELNEFRSEVNDFRNEVNDFRSEMRDINRNSQSTLNNYEARIAHLEYVNKSS